MTIINLFWIYNTLGNWYIRLLYKFKPIETANGNCLSTRAAASHSKFFLVGTTASRRIIKLFGRSSVLIVELYGKITTGRDYVSGSPGQRIRRNWVHDNASLNDKLKYNNYYSCLLDGKAWKYYNNFDLSINFQKIIKMFYIFM